MSSRPDTACTVEDSKKSVERVAHLETCYPNPEEITKRRGSNLPHWTHRNSIYHVTFRLHDSLPREVLIEWQSEKDRISSLKELNVSEIDSLQRMLSEKIHRALDSGTGSCMLKDRRIASIVFSACLHFDKSRYLLHGLAVMPNHVHLVIQCLDPHSLPQILQNLKSYSSHRINKLLNRKGKLWQAEYFDHLIRNEAAFLKTLTYVKENPLRAGLAEWPWVYVASEIE